MKLLLARHLWGLPGKFADLFPGIKKQGYEAIEVGLSEIVDQAEEFCSLLDQYGFEYIPQIFTTGNNVEEHVQAFQRDVRRAKVFNPRFINCHAGRDTWTFEESVQFYERVLAIEEEEGVNVAHETHRGRVLFYPTVTRLLLERFPQLKLCLDVSHWVCVCERLLEDQAETLAQVAEHCLHIHARVGYEEGPQVPDPRAPEYLHHVEAHERWWRMVWDSQEKRGLAVSTLTPEFGPPPYLHALPYTQTPVANLEDICNWQAHRLAEQFARRQSVSYS